MMYRIKMYDKNALHHEFYAISKYLYVVSYRSQSPHPRRAGLAGGSKSEGGYEPTPTNVTTTCLLGMVDDDNARPPVDSGRADSIGK